jgi:excinuclease ABC subunit C
MNSPLFESVKDLVKLLPEHPGVYQYYNKEGRIIYVGKAKNLRKRVSSYFSKEHSDRKTKILVRQIADIRHIVVETEEDALLLENNLIKKYQPRYNILLKDDKSYPWICVKNETFPRVFYTRKLIRDGSIYFGPYTSVAMVKTLLEIIKQLFTIRNCNLNLSEHNIQKGKYKVCLEYHIKNCLGPCEGFQYESGYLSEINQVKEILKGNLSSVFEYLNDKMRGFSADYRYEEAAMIKEKIKILEGYRSKSAIFSASLTNIEAISFAEDPKSAFVNYLKVVNGAIVQSHNFEIKKRLNESKEDLMGFAIAEVRQIIGSGDSIELLVPFKVDLQLKKTIITVPIRGDKKKLLDFSERNAKFYRLEKLKSESVKSPEMRLERLMLQMKSDLRLSDPPVHIECFDNSNIQGDSAVAACVVFKNGKPSKSDYRHFNIKTVVGANDFASMEEIIYRRYSRLLDENQSLPQLIVIDGGKGQLGSALNSLSRLGLVGKISVIGIAKRLEEIFYPGDPLPLYLDKNSETLKVLQYLRNEAHRFGITFHRSKRSNKFLNSELDAISGVGERTKEKLLKAFGSIEQIKRASLLELEAIVGNKAKILTEYFEHDSSVRKISL